MEEQDEEGAPTPPLEQRIGGVERRGLVDIVRQQDDTPAAAIAIGGLAVNMNVEGQRENFDGTPSVICARPGACHVRITSESPIQGVEGSGCVLGGCASGYVKG